MSLVVFEDEKARQLSPITNARPAYAITCGGYRLCDLLRISGAKMRGVVRKYLADIQRLDYSDFAPAGVMDAGEKVVLINARIVPSIDILPIIKHLHNNAEPGAVFTGGELAAAVLPPDAPRPTTTLTAESMSDFVNFVGVPSLPRIDANLPLFEYPHDIIRYNMAILNNNLAYKLKHGDYQEIADGVFAKEGSKLGPHCVTDASEGPIVLDENVSIGPFCLLTGPLVIGKNSRVTEHSAIKDAVSLAHTVKIGGEIEASVVEPYTNKQHYGFLGHSYLGSWINLGAGTCNSDLKNTYGTVNMDYNGEKVPTGMQFVGCVVGDYSKTAINTGIFTGKVIGVCSMAYGFITTNVPAFVNYARLFGQMTELSPEVIVATQGRMFARRKVEQRPCDVQLIHDMYEQTRRERELAAEPLTL